MTHNTENLLDGGSIELIVGYDYETSPSQIEECHGFHEVGNLIYTELSSVELVIKGVGIDILPLLNDRQKKEIISQLNYE